MKYLYYPGCSLHATAKEYDESAHAVCKVLGIDLVELPDWSCCGASSAHVVNHDLAAALPARNLFIAEKEGMDLLVLCAACFNRLKIARHEIAENDRIRVRLEEIMKYKYKGSVNVKHLMEVILKEVGVEELKNKVTDELVGFKAVPYYGCLMVRPEEVMQFEHSDNPTHLDKILGAIGVEVMPWSYKADCCGGSLTLTQAETVTHLVDNLLNQAADAGANCVVTGCPMCMMNLEMRRSKNAPNLPVFYFTDLIGMALGQKEWKRWLDMHLVDSTEFMAQRDQDKEEKARLDAEKAAAKAAKEAKKKAEKEKAAEAEA